MRVFGFRCPMLSFRQDCGIIIEKKKEQKSNIAFFAKLIMSIICAEKKAKASDCIVFLTNKISKGKKERGHKWKPRPDLSLGVMNV